MGKRFIHLDELLRSIKPPDDDVVSSDAWMRMSEALDKEMPTEKEHKSYFVYFLSALLTITVGVGAVAFQQLEVGKPASSIVQNKPVNAIENTVDKFTIDEKIDQNEALNTNSTEDKQHIASNNDATSANHKNQSHNKIASTRSVVANHQNKVNLREDKLSDLDRYRKNVSLDPVTKIAYNKKNQIKSKDILIPNESLNNAIKTENKDILNHQIAKINDLELNDKKINQSDLSIGNLSNINSDNDLLNLIKPNAENKLNNAFVKENGKWFKKVDKAYTRINVIDKVKKDKFNDRLVYSTDTLSIDSVIVKELVPLNKIELAVLESSLRPKITSISADKLVASNNKLFIKPHANASKDDAINTNVVNKSGLVSLEDYKVKSLKLNKFSNNINNLITGQHGVFNGNRNFYIGLSGGLNYGMQVNNTLGYQFGMSAYYQVRERVTLMAEVKWVNTLFSNHPILDHIQQYQNVKTWDKNGTTMYEGNNLSKDVFYNLESYNRIDVPVLAIYNFTKFNVYAGPVVSFINAMKYSSTTYNSSEGFENVTSEKPLVNTDPQWNNQALSTRRWGIGYAVGANYDINKNFGVDVRVNQLLTNKNNSNLNNQAIKNVNGDIFNKPNAQLSLYYYIGRKEKVVYMMGK